MHEEEAVTAPDSRVVVIACIAACAGLLASCGGGDEGGSPDILPDACGRVGNPDFTGPGYGAIGPGGGVVEDTDPSSPVAGVRLEVEPGAWSECWEVHVGYASIFSTPDYPTGYVPFERRGPSGAVEIQVGLHNSTGGFFRAPDPLPIKLSFPMSNIHPATLDIRSAYFFDRANQKWRVVLPGALTRERLAVTTTAHDALWSWGRVDLGRIDFTEHMKPALEAYYGTETLAAIAAAQDDIRHQAEKRQWQFTCAGLAGAQAFFASTRDAAAANIERIQASLGCGPCNPLTEQFQKEFDEWWEVKRWSVALDFAGIVTMKEPGDVLQVALTPLIKDQQEWVQCLFDVVGCVIDQLAPDTHCDYECYFRKVPSAEMNLDKAVYYGCDWVRGTIERYRTQIMSPPCK
jgi:hypothetical protein